MGDLKPPEESVYLEATTGTASCRFGPGLLNDAQRAANKPIYRCDVCRGKNNENMKGLQFTDCKHALCICCISEMLYENDKTVDIIEDPGSVNLQCIIC